MPGPLRSTPPEAVELIKSFEGIPDGDPGTVNLDAYLDPLDIWTIGWGHALVVDGKHLKGAANKAVARAAFPGGITFAQAEALLQADLLDRSPDVLRRVKVPLDDGEFGALMSFVFNAGGANFGASTLLKKLNAGDRAGAADQLLAWNKGRRNGVLVELPGLTRRRKAERAMFLGEDWRAAAGIPRTRGRATPIELPRTLAPERPEPPAADRIRPRARTTTATALPPPAPARRRAPRTAR